MPATRMLQIHYHDSLCWGIEVRKKEKFFTFIGDERKLILEVADEFFEWRIGRRFCVANEYLVLWIGAVRDGQDEILAVVRRGHAEIPVRMIGPLVDDFIVCLLRAQFVKRNHLIERGGLMQFAGGRLGIAVVVKAAAVLRPID